MSTISVIVPVYNAEDTLEHCVGSILSQTFVDFDVILVDDGSTDISGAMSDIYAEFEPRIQTIHTPNRGLSAARNLGISQALADGAEFIAFADSDDWLEPHMLEELLMALEISGADIAQCGYRLDGSRTTSDVMPPALEYDRQGAIRALISGPVSNGVWNKLYRMSIFKELRFPEGRAFEDVATMHRILLQSNKLICIPSIGYHYVMREGSIVHTQAMRNLVDFWTAHKERRDFLLTEVPDYLDAKSRDQLIKNEAYAISRMWRWAYSNSPRERESFGDIINEMQSFMESELKDVDMSTWPITLKIALLFARSSSSISFAAAFCANQFFIRVFPKRAGSRI